MEDNGQHSLITVICNIDEYLTQPCYIIERHYFHVETSVMSDTEIVRQPI